MLCDSMSNGKNIEQYITYIELFVGKTKDELIVEEFTSQIKK